jgi:hypothetical protein
MTVRRKRKVISHAALLLELAVLTSCTPSLRVADTTSLCCTETRECPDGWRCIAAAGRCAPINADHERPSLRAGASIVPSRLKRGDVITVTVSPSEPLLVAPTLTLEGTSATRTLAPVAGSSDPLVFTGTVQGDEGEGAALATSFR